ISLRDSAVADISKSEAFESDNNSSGSTATPFTSAVFSNMTAIGPRASLYGTGNSLFLAGAHIRRNSKISIMNSVFMGWPNALLIDASTGTPVDKNIDDSTIRFRYNTLAGNGGLVSGVPTNVNAKYTASSSAATGKTTASIEAWIADTYYANTATVNAVDAKLIQPFNYTAFDPTPYAGSNSPASGLLTFGIAGNYNYSSNGNFTDPKLQDAFLKKVTFRGAIGLSGEDATWWKGWTKWNY
ncbi:MAG: hypothetical protein RL185_725, partial [Bacteroidota bacterium]